MKTHKKCKGQNKAIKFSGCGDLVAATTRKYGLCRKCFTTWLYSTEEGKEVISKTILKVQKPRLEAEESLNKELQQRINRKSITTLLNQVKNYCHKYVRLRDKNKPCVSCGIPYKSDFDAGHYYKAELYSDLKFNENNIHGQCIKCNRMNEGNLNEYSISLPKRIGIDLFNELKTKAENSKKKSFKWDREELERLRDYYRNKIKEL